MAIALSFIIILSMNMINDLIEKDILQKEEGGGRSTNYELKEIGIQG
jgi:hypothetical protein